MRKCRNCRTELPRKQDTDDRWKQAGFCNVDCMADYGKAKAVQQRERARRKRQQERKAKTRTRSDAAKSAQQAFNKWVRLRDRDKPCISCGRYHEGQWHAGHYRSVGAAPELRFEPLNVHRQCMPCNSHKSGNVIEYRINLVQRIGQDAVDWLEGPHEPNRYTIEELDEIAAHYRRECRLIESNKNAD